MPNKVKGPSKPQLLDSCDVLKNVADLDTAAYQY